MCGFLRLRKPEGEGGGVRVWECGKPVRVFHHFHALELTGEGGGGFLLALLLPLPPCPFSSLLLSSLEVCPVSDYLDCYEYLNSRFSQVDGCAFYAELFPDNENAGERHTDFSHPNAVYLYRDEQGEEHRLRRRKMCNDTWEQDYKEFVEGNSLTLCSGLTYRRNQNTAIGYSIFEKADGVGHIISRQK